jgi:phage shock protein E
MLSAIKNFFKSAKPEYKNLMAAGAVIVDVRTTQEFSGGHIKNAVNIPVDNLRNNLSKLKNKNQPIITCCASGIRSGMAKSILKANGYTDVHNGGSWLSLQKKIN